MAFTIDDFNKVWASTSPLTPYEFSESNYKEGWNFIGSNPPARQMWDFLQKQNDEKMQYLYNNTDVLDDFTDDVTFTETYVRAEFLRVGRLVTIMYQGENKTHANGDTVFTIPAEYLPHNIKTLTRYFVVGSFNQTASTFCITSAGAFTCQSASSSSARVYVQFSYFI